jgi:methyl-accepting chemotaxis protein
MFVEKNYGTSADYDLFWTKLRQGEFQAAEFKRFGKGDKEIWIQASYNPIFDPNGKPFKVVKFATDITAQVQKRMDNEKIGSDVEHDLGEISHSLDNVTMQTTSAASAATQTATTVQTIAAGAEELNSSVQEIAQSMSHSKDSVEKVIGLTDNADKSTQSLTLAAEQMSGIVSIIQDIANQINLLALNATIESARAGEAGKGFAVVASEVKNLATQVGQATDKISQEITGMQSISSDVVRILNNIKEAISGVQISVSGVASAIEEQSAVTTEISSNMQVASDACAEVDKNLRDVLESVSSSTGYVKQVQSMSKQLLN